MKHVALVIPGLDRIGGAERQALLIARGLRQRGSRVSVVVLSGSAKAAANELRQAEVDFVSLGMRKGLADPRGWWRFHRWLTRERPDVVHAHLPHAAWLARWSCLAARIPVLIDTLHSSSTGAFGRRLGYRLSSRLPDRVTAVSRAVAQTHREAGMVRPEKLVVIPNGIDTETFRPNATQREEVRRVFGFRSEFLWLAAGRLETVKDFPTLLQAMTGVPEPARLLIAGSGPLEVELRALAARLGIVARIHFLGFVPDIARYMQTADGFVLSSLWEGLPLALLEAAACGLPAVACNVPGVRETVIEGETGWLVRSRDSVALAAGMRRLMQVSPLERRAIGANARRRVVQQFGIEEVLDRWERLYCEAGKPKG
jgi:glycosyltransferase involved in cell wall biosynthesis